MNFGSNLILAENRAGSTNCFSSTFDHISNELAVNNVNAGEPVMCKNCHSILSIFSTVKNEEWICEFCSFKNVDIEEEEIPESETIEFLLSKPKQEEKDATDESSLIFCIDTSGSMCTTEELSEPFELPPLHGQAGSLYFLYTKVLILYNTKARKAEYVSRLEFVQSSVYGQIDKIAKATPNKKVGLVTFGSEVTYYGDGQLQKPIVFEGELLDSIENLMEQGTMLKLENSIENTKDDFSRAVLNLSETGPALILSVMVASKKPGSKVIVCTDGLNLDSTFFVDIHELKNQLDHSQKVDFYEEIGKLAKRKGVCISVVSIKGAETKLEKLGALANLTGGDVDLVDSSNLNFDSFLNDSVIATQTSLNVLLPHFLKFMYEENSTSNVISRDIGNVTKDTDSTFEFSLADNFDKSQINDNIAFQTQIKYTNLTGEKRLKIITKKMKITESLEEALQSINILVVSANLAQQSSRMARDGDYEGALKNAKNVKLLIENPVVKKSENFKQLYSIFLEEFNQISTELNKLIEMENKMKNEGDIGNYDRAELRGDFAAQKLYNYGNAKKNECLIQ